MTVDAVQVPCPHCRLSSPPGRPGLGYWECPGCKRAFFLRRCRACQAVSHVGAQQSWHHRWQCVWCEHRNFGFSRLGDPAAATVADLVADLRRRGLTLAPGDADRQTQPIPVVTAVTAQPPTTPLGTADAAPPAQPAGAQPGQSRPAPPLALTAPA